MTLPPLTLVPAGAGSGKTYRIQTTLSRWIADGLVRPERIVAVTYTEAAAGELRGRLKAELVNAKRHEDALRLDQAYISTIHSFGLRVMTEYAFEAKRSPAPRSLIEDEQRVLLRRALARTESVQPITQDLRRFGYKYDGHSGIDAVQQLESTVLNAARLQRDVGREGADPHLVRETLQFITSTYGPTKDADKLTKALYKAIHHLLDKFPENLVESHGGTNQTACDELNRDWRNLMTARDKPGLVDNFALWQALRYLRQSNRLVSLPNGYDELAEKIMAAASQLPRHPGPLQEARTHANALLAGAQEMLQHYGRDKLRGGLVDFTDMIALARGLLRDHPAVLADLRGRIDCLVVDEFQDTNPLQFSLLWSLTEAGVPTLLVGDMKQAIMGFQGADSRLFAALLERFPKTIQPLDANWRSQPALMVFINALGSKLFGDTYQPLTPRAKASARPPVELIAFPTPAPKGVNSRHRCCALRTGARLRDILNGTRQRVIDRTTGEKRRPRGSDIALLCPTNDMLTKYAEIFRELGLRVRMPEEGWLTSRAIQLAMHGLAYVADPGDRHAALYLAVTELGRGSLHDMLSRMIDGEAPADPLLARLDVIAEHANCMTVDTVLGEVLAALGLYDAVARWPEGAQARADLLRLQGEARGFLETNQEALHADGYYGSGLPSFLAWLRGRAEHDDTRPDAQVIDEDAIDLSTWHRAKGREWPIVAVAGLDRKIEPRLPEIVARYAGFTDLDRLLEQARLEFSPRFAAPESNERFLTSLRPEERVAARRRLYVALTRARETLIVEWQSHIRPGRQTYWNLLTEDCGLTLKNSVMHIGDDQINCRVYLSDPPKAETTEDSTLPPAVGRRAIRPGVSPTELTPDIRQPSRIAGDQMPAMPTGVVTLAQYGSSLDVRLPGAATERGTFLHGAFAAGADRLARFTASSGVAMPEGGQQAIGAATLAFDAWLANRFADAMIARELPLLGLDGGGSVINGAIDLLVEASDGLWIIDHKSDAVADPEGEISRHLGQLSYYAEALRSQRPGVPIAGLGINWIMAGSVALLELH